MLYVQKYSISILNFPFFVCMHLVYVWCMFARVFVHMCANARVCVHVEGRGQHWVPLSIPLCLPA